MRQARVTSALRLSPLAERPFRFLWLGQGVTSIGDTLVPVALAFAVLSIGGDASDFGRVLAGLVIARVGLTLIGGVWADRLPRQRVMLASDLVRAATQGTLGFLLITGSAELWHLQVGMVAYGAAAAFFGPASTGLLPSVVAAERLQQANALMSLTRSVAYVAGPGVSGLLVEGVGPGWVFALDSATFAASALALGLRRIPGNPTVVPRRFLRELADGWHEFRRRRWVAMGIAYFALFNLAIAPFYVLGPVIADSTLGGAADWGLIMTSAGVGSLLGSMLALRLRPERPLVLGFSLVALTALQPFALAGEWATASIAAAALAGVTVVTIGNTLWVTSLQEHVPRDALSRVTAYDWMGSQLFTPLGYLLAGVLSETVGRSETLYGAGLLLAVASLAVIAIPSIRDVRRAAPVAPPDAVPV
jgi:MFS family permease